jgi:hypothetical protein
MNCIHNCSQIAETMLNQNEPHVQTVLLLPTKNPQKMETVTNMFDTIDKLKRNWTKTVILVIVSLRYIAYPYFFQVFNYKNRRSYAQKVII